MCSLSIYTELNVCAWVVLFMPIKQTVIYCGIFSTLLRFSKTRELQSSKAN